MERIETAGKSLGAVGFRQGGGLISHGEYEVQLWPGGERILDDAGLARFSADGALVLSTSSRRPVRVQRVADRSVVAELAADQIGEAAFSPDGSLVAVGAGAGSFGPGDPPQEQALRSVGLWRPGEPSVEWLGTHGFSTREDSLYGDIHYLNGVTALAFSPDGSLLASAGDEGGLRVWDVAARAERARVELGPLSRLNRISFADADTVIGGWQSDGRSVIWKWREGRAETEKRGSVLAVSRGRALASDSRRVRVVALPGFEELRGADLAKGEVAWVAAFDSDGERAVVGTSRGGLVVL